MGRADSLSQTISAVTPGVTAAMLDTGTLLAGVSFYEQGLNQGTPSDDAFISLTFLDVNGRPISTVSTPEVDSHLNGWERYSDNFSIPVGTRSMTYTMNFVRHSGSDLDAFVDDTVLNIKQGTGAGLKVSPTSLDFGLQPYNVLSATKALTVSNPGTTTITFQDILLDLGANPFDFTESDNCPAALVAGASCQVNIAFLPHGVGPKSSGLQIDDDTDTATLGIGVSGTGTGGVLQENPGNLKAIAGNGVAGDTGDGGPATAAEINQPGGIGFDPAGNLYIADTQAAVVRKVSPTGIISTFAGTGVRGFSGDGGPATQAQLLLPFSVVSDATGNIFIQDTGNYVIRRVDKSTGIITTYAGTPGAPGYAGDGGPASAAHFNQNQGARFDAAGNFFVPQCARPSIRRIDTAGNISTVAGNFTGGFSGDGGQATSAQLNCPSGVTIDTAGNFYIADEFNQRVRKVNAQGIITTIAGTGTQGSSGDGGPATAAQLNNPNDVQVDAAGNLYIADSGNNEVRKIDQNGVITTVAGGLQNAGSPGVNTPLSLTLDATGNLYFAATGNSEIFELFPAGTTPFPPTPVGTAAAPQTLTLSNIGNLPVTIGGSGSFSTSGNTGDFALTGGSCLSGATLAPASGTCTLQVSFTPTAGGLRNLTVSVADSAVNSPQSFTVSGSGAGAPMLTWTPPASIVYGTPLGPAQFNAVATGAGGAAVAGSYAYTPAAGSVLGVGVQTLSVVFTSADPNYLGATASVPLTVTKAMSTIAWATPASIPFGTALSSAQLNAVATGVGGAALTGTFAYSPGAGTILSAGVQTLNVVFTPNDANYRTATANVQFTVTKATPTVVWAAPASIVYGTKLSAAQLNATATGQSGTALAGTFVYTPAAGTVPGAGVQTLNVTFTASDANYATATASVPLTVTKAVPTVGWAAPAAIGFGTPLSAAQLNATATGIGGAAVAGTYVYTPAAGTVPGVGTQTLQVLFTATDANYGTATASVPLTVTRAALTLTWATPTAIAYGIPLGAAQLDAVVTGVGGAAVPGTYTYTPAAGTVLAPGTSTLNVSFAPTDATDYGVVLGSTSINVTGLSFTSFTPNTARAGDASTVITLTGSGFVPTSIVLVNGTAIAATYVSDSTLTAVVPASVLTKVATLQVTVSDPGISAFSAGLPLTVINANPAVTLTGPSTTQPGSQPSVTFTVTNPYPIALTASFNLSFASAVTPSVDDPSIQFAAGGRNYTFTVPANSVAVPPILIQAGTVAGTITVPLTLTAQGVDVTPANLQPVVIVIPRAAPVISTTTLTRSGGELSIAVHGFSNTREVTTATFHFVAATGATVTTADVTAPVTPLFTTWFDGTVSPTYGSAFTYTQVFDVSDDAANIGSVQVTLTNSVGISGPGMAQ